MTKFKREMSFSGAIVRLSVTVVFFACLLMLPSFEWHRHKLLEYLKGCLLNWFSNSGVNSDTDISKRLIRTSTSDLVFTKEELALYDGGGESKGLYVAILGRIYDVEGGSKSYQPGGGYSFFAARDGTKAFVTGEFNDKGLTDDISTLTPRQMLEALRWLQFYEKTYPYIGKVAGYCYGLDGSPSDALIAAERVLEAGLELQKQEADHQKIFPPCNSHWTDKDGTTVWCSDKSGGIERNWDGVPRLYFDHTTQQTRCVCVRTTGKASDPSRPDDNTGDLSHPSLREYTGCSPHSNACKVI